MFPIVAMRYGSAEIHEPDMNKPSEDWLLN
jgi:hypothetical protein